MVGTVDAISHNIQLAVAPVFLLTGIASVLNVLTNRLGRVIDRARKVEAEISGYDLDTKRRATRELTMLNRRMTAAHWAIGLCTLSALFVCIVVAILFVGDVIPGHVSQTVAPLFILVMVLLIAGLLLFLFEVQIATRSVRIRAEMLDR
ncbi:MULTISPECIES: DUF2721 domain-containing protein [Sphingosinicellaceae]|uniref:DUF2721 domain-containing protein n=1 Tax=Sphingosinicellaceae TaxID=2820280 RepID=UPI001C1DF984|nr:MULTISPECIES: DUF2721 domain-containing protein [Polymorphobacter]QYE33963.1 DUF2721 domain-containing protein [Polymorphobacter sp. PAMC 29334]UAJ09132.1 DUF2721 domain-containing protein [Polymorphobacter megasporae]